jgi:hypothetical protein
MHFKRREVVPSGGNITYGNNSRGWVSSRMVNSAVAPILTLDRYEGRAVQAKTVPFSKLNYAIKTVYLILSATALN